MLYWYGRLANLFVDFEPIPVDDDFEIDRLYSAEGLMASMIASPHRKSSLKGGNHPIVGSWYSSSYNFMSGFINATFTDGAPNATVCTGNITHVRDSAMKFYE